MKRHLMISLLLAGMVLLTLVPGVSAQAPLEISDIQSCTDGLKLTVNTPVTADETLIVAWGYMDEVYGVAANAVFLSGLSDPQQNIVLPHVQIPVGSDIGYLVAVTDPELSSRIADLLLTALLTGQVPGDNEVEILLGSTPVVAQSGVIEDCSVAGETLTRSNTQLDPAMFLPDLSELEPLIQQLLLLLSNMLSQ